MASTHATDSMKFEVPRWTVYLIVAVLVLTASIIAALTIKERVTDPAIEAAGEELTALEGAARSASEAADAASVKRRRMEADALEAMAENRPYFKTEVIDQKRAVSLARKYDQDETATAFEQMTEQQVMDSAVFVLVEHRETGKKNVGVVRFESGHVVTLP